MVSKVSFLVLVCFFISKSLGDLNVIKGLVPSLDPEKLFEKVGEYLEKCVEQTGVKLEELEKYGNTSQEKLCFFRCLGMEAGTLDSDGTIVMEKMKETLTAFGLPDDKMSVFTECVEKIEKIQECDDMVKLVECEKRLAE